MTTITQSISSLGSVPTTADPSTFDSRADTFLGTTLPNLRTEINTWAGQANTVAGEVNTNASTATTQANNASASASAAAASASAASTSASTAALVAAGLGNFIGLWSAQTGAKTVPTSVSHNGVLYYLLSNIADITTKTPGVASEWAAIERVVREARTSNTILDVADHGKIIEITSGTFSQTVQASATLGNSWFCYLINSGSGTVTLDPNGAETVDGSSTKVLLGGIVYLLLCDGSNLRTYGTALTADDHEVVVRTGNGFGSTNTAIRRYTTTERNVGTAITYADSASNGASFTINHDGIYAITMCDGNPSSGSGLFGITKNSAQLTTAIDSVTASTRLGGYSELSSGTNAFYSQGWSGRLAKGDVIRPHYKAPTTGNTSDGVMFQIAKIGH